MSMSDRDEFAKAALIGLLSRDRSNIDVQTFRTAYHMADVMLVIKDKYDSDPKYTQAAMIRAREELARAKVI